MKLELFKDKNNKYRIRMKARNGRIIMSSEAYSSRAKAEKTMDSIVAAAFWLDIATPTRDASSKIKRIGGVKQYHNYRNKNKQKG